MARLAILLPDMRSGGAERVALTLSGKLAQRGHELDLVLMSGGGELLGLLPPGIGVFDLGADRIRRSIRPLAHYLQQRSPDALLAAMWPLTLVPLLARLLAGVPTRIVVSDHTMLSKEYAGRGLFHRLLLRASIALGYPLADARVAVSEGVADEMARLGGLDRRSIEVIFNPVFLDPNARRPAPPDWGGKGPRILTVGSMKSAKNHQLLLKAFARMDPNLNARLMIVGDGPMRPALERLRDELGIGHRVCLPGSTIDPSPYYASADLFVLSSDHEGYPLVLAEAMLHGLRIVSTDCEFGPREILDGGKYGRLVRPGAAAELALAMGDMLITPHDPETVRHRAAALSHGAVNSYEHLLVPDCAGRPL